MEHLNDIVQFRMGWFGGLSEEDRGKVVADRASWTEEPTKSEREAEF